MSTEDTAYREFIAAEAERFFLRGWTAEAIGNELGLSVRRVNQLLEPCRKLLAEGGYTQELAKLAAEGFTGLPTSAHAKPGRRAAKLTGREHSMRSLYLQGLGTRAIAATLNVSRDRVRHVLAKAPSVLGRRGEKPLDDKGRTLEEVRALYAGAAAFRASGATLPKREEV